MPIERRFFPEHHLLYERVFGTLTLDEIVELQAGEMEILQRVETPIHIIVDLRSLQQFPTSLIDIKDKVSMINSPNLRWMILVANTSRLLKFLASVVMQMALRHVRYRMFDSMEEAEAFLADMDATLDLHELFLQIEKQHR